MAVYRFRITFEDYDDVVREIDIKSNQNFEDLHRAIHQSTGYNAELSSSFYVSTDQWIKGDEIAFLPSDKKKERGVALMSNSKLGSFVDDPHQKFYYTYNFERPFDFHVELVKILDSDPKITYPNLFKVIGDAPKVFQRNIGIANLPPKSEEFDFLNELEFSPADDDEIAALDTLGVNEEEVDEVVADEEDEKDEFSDEFSDTDNYDSEDIQKDEF